MRTYIRTYLFFLGMFVFGLVAHGQTPQPIQPNPKQTLKGLGKRLLEATEVKLLGALAPTAPQKITPQDLGAAFAGRLTKVTNVLTEHPNDVFEGVSLGQFADAYMSKNCNCDLRIEATNKYQELVPLDKSIEGKGILAFAKNGVLLRAGDRGPMRLVFSSRLTQPDAWRLFERWSVWEIASLEFVPKSNR